ncbi:MAG: cyclase family protein [Acidimicrobiia bacterium]|nr:cyclase family protein [Acidimicrobiia bacterium]
MSLANDFVELAKRVSNWGRWGDDDERGTLNLIDADAVRRGAACVRTGKTFSLALPLNEDGPQTGVIPGRDNPAHRMVAINMAFTGDPDAFATSDDAVSMGLQAATHWDALAHVSYGGFLYNGFPASSVTEAGAAHCGVDKAGTIVTRGVLLDVARARDVERVEGGHAIGADDLEAARELAKVDVQPGDVMLVRTGQIQVLHSGDKDAYGHPSPGPGIGAVPWFRDHDIAAVATDNLTFEVFPCERDDFFLPVHLLDLRDIGLTQGQNWDLEALAADCADDGVYSFLLEASPQPFTGATGSPVNPIATK